MFLPSIKQGKLTLPLNPNKKLQMISLDVIGTFGAKILRNSSEFIGKDVEIASDEITLAEAMELLSKATGKKIAYEELPEEMAEKGLGSDFAKMFKWFSDVGFSIKIEDLKKHGIPLTTYKEHLASASWVKNV